MTFVSQLVEQIIIENIKSIYKLILFITIPSCSRSLYLSSHNNNII